MEEIACIFHHKLVNQLVNGGIASVQCTLLNCYLSHVRSSTLKYRKESTIDHHWSVRATARRLVYRTAIYSIYTTRHDATRHKDWCRGQISSSSSSALIARTTRVNGWLVCILRSRMPERDWSKVKPPHINEHIILRQKTVKRTIYISLHYTDKLQLSLYNRLVLKRQPNISNSIRPRTKNVLSMLMLKNK